MFEIMKLASRCLRLKVLPIVFTSLFCVVPTFVQAQSDEGAQVKKQSKQALKKSFEGDSTNIIDIEFKETAVGDAIRVLSEMSGLNIIATAEARKKNLTLYLSNTTVKDAVDSLCSITGLWYRHNKETGVYIIMTTEEYSEDVVVSRTEYTRVFTMKHHNVAAAAETIEALFGSRVEVTEPNNEGSYELDDSLDDASSSGSSNSNNNGRSNFTRNNSSRNRSNFSSRSGSSSQNENEISDISELSTSQLRALQTQGALVESIDEGIVAGISQQLKAKIYVTYNELHNLLFVRSGDEIVLDDIAALVEQIDQPAKQVLLQMKILRVLLDDEQRSVFDYQMQESDSKNAETLGLGNAVLEGGTLVYQRISERLLATVELLEAEGRVETLSTPLLLASDNKAAEIFLGEERVLVRGFTRRENIINDSYVSTSFLTDTDIRLIGNRLKIWPRINDDRTVTLDIDHEISSLNRGASTIPLGVDGTSFPIDSVDVSELNLTAIAKDGMSIAVGGMISSSDSDRSEKVPLLGSIPGLGVLFRKDVDQKSKSELILMITPHVLDTPEEAERVKEELAKSEYESPLIDQHLEEGLINSPIYRNEMTADELKLSTYIQKAWNRAEQELVDDNLEAGQRWMTFSGLEAQALASWRMGKHYATMVRLQNINNELVNLQADEMGLGWRAVAFEYPTLSKGEEIWVCLISRKPFQLAFKHSNDLAGEF